MYSYSSKFGIVDLKTSPSAYGEIMTVTVTPVIQSDFNYGVNGQLFATSSLSGSIGTLDSNLVLECSGTVGSFAEVKSRKIIRYRPGQGNGIRFTAMFVTGSSGAKQLYGVGDADGGIFLGMSGSNFGIMRRSFGEEHWTFQQEFNIDKLDGSNGTHFTYDPEKGNVFDIQYQWLGYGVVTYNIEDPESGNFIPFHRIKYPNKNVKPSTEFGSNPISIRVECFEETAVKPQIKGASVFAYLEGSLVYTGPTFSASGSNSSIGTSSVNLVTIKNEQIYNAKTNKIPSKTKGMSFSSDGSQPVVIRLIKNSTLTGSPVYISASVDSVMTYTTSSLLTNGGSSLATFVLGKTDSFYLSEKDFETFLSPGETLTIAGNVNGGTSTVVAAVNWLEDH
jgi:hypothetical protein